MLDHHLQDALEAVLDPIGEQARNHLNAVLRCRQLRLNRRPSGRLQHVSIQPLRCAGDAGALGLHLIEIGHHAKRLLAHKRLNQRRNHARSACSNDCARLHVHHVVDVDLIFDDDHARMDRLRQAIKRVAHDRGFDQLQIHCLIGNRLAKDRVWRGIRLQQREWRILHHLIMENIGAVAD